MPLKLHVSATGGGGGVKKKVAEKVKNMTKMNPRETIKI